MSQAATMKPTKKSYDDSCSRSSEIMNTPALRKSKYYINTGSFRHHNNYETEAYGIPQLEPVDLETLSLFKSRKDLACLRDLLNAKCFIGKAHNVVCDFCALTIVSIYHMLTL